MSEIKLTITGMDPVELFSTIKGFAALLADDVPTAVPEEKTQAQPINSTPTVAPPAAIPTAATPSPEIVPPVPTIPTAAPAPSIPTAAPAVPTTQAPAYTIDQLSRAGADLITAHPEHMGKLNAIMAGYGVQTIAQLPKEYYGDLALKLRELGAQI